MRHRFFAIRQYVRLCLTRTRTPAQLPLAGDLALRQQVVTLVCLPTFAFAVIAAEACAALAGRTAFERGWRADFVEAQTEVGPNSDKTMSHARAFP
jgi:hypothetical protein